MDPASVVVLRVVTASSREVAVNCRVARAAAARAAATPAVRHPVVAVISAAIQWMAAATRAVLPERESAADREPAIKARGLASARLAAAPPAVIKEAMIEAVTVSPTEATQVAWTPVTKTAADSCRVGRMSATRLAASVLMKRVINPDSWDSSAMVWRDQRTDD
jgi:hypothetical protein